MSKALAVLLFIKILIYGLSLSDSFGALICLAAVQLDRVTGHLFPKQVDLFTEVSEIQSRLMSMQDKLDDNERDLTALKFGTMRPK